MATTSTHQPLSLTQWRPEIMKKSQLFTTGRILASACLGVVMTFGASAAVVDLNPTDEGRINLTDGNVRKGNIGGGRAIRTGTSATDEHFQGFMIFDTSSVVDPLTGAVLNFEIWDPVQGSPGNLQLFGVSSTAGFDALADDTELNNIITNGGALIQDLGEVAPGVQNIDVTAFVMTEIGNGNPTIGFLFKHANVTDSGGVVDMYQINDSNDPAAQRPELSLTTIPEPTSLALLGLGGLLVARRRRG